ncbi:MAG: hypothetical protein D6748_08110, partial [Calditrichaeota bacterium]
QIPEKEDIPVIISFILFSVSSRGIINEISRKAQMFSNSIIHFQTNIKSVPMQLNPINQPNEGDKC